ncbi:hypothetical protein GOP47_0026808 [Adiantum capillus-veneris]|nr:hypothetical protein GOP47_0026808 [Adiantum capillus-veneris]
MATPAPPLRAPDIGHSRSYDVDNSAPRSLTPALHVSHVARETSGIAVELGLHTRLDPSTREAAELTSSLPHTSSLHSNVTASEPLRQQPPQGKEA